MLAPGGRFDVITSYYSAATRVRRPGGRRREMNWIDVILVHLFSPGVGSLKNLESRKEVGDEKANKTVKK